MLGRSSLRWRTCGTSTSRAGAAGHATQRSVAAQAYKRSKQRPGFADPAPYPGQVPNYQLPPLDGTAAAPPQQAPPANGAPAQAPPQQQGQQRPAPRPGFQKPPQQGAGYMNPGPPQQPGFIQQTGPVQVPAAAPQPPQAPAAPENPIQGAGGPPQQGWAQDPGFGGQQAAQGGAQSPSQGWQQQPQQQQLSPQQQGLGWQNTPQQPGLQQGAGYMQQPTAPGYQQQQPQQQQQQAGMGYQQNPYQGYQQNPNQGYQQNPNQGYQQNPSQGYQQNPSQGYQQNPNQGYQQNPNQGGYYQQQPGGPTYQQQQQQQPAWSQAGYLDEGGYLNDQAGAYLDDTGAPGDVGRFINTPQRNNWGQQGGSTGFYRNNRQQQQQQGGYNYNDQSLNQEGGYLSDAWGPTQTRGRQNFAGFVDPSAGAGAWADDYLLSQLDRKAGRGAPGNFIDGWEDEVEVEEDMTPKYVNGKRVLVNSEIAAPKVRVQDISKAELGVMTFDDARDLAIRQNADVVMINDGGDPPVVRLVAFSKYKYELEKSAKQKQKASKGPEVKEVKLRPVTEKADYDTKIRQAQKFLSKGAKVKLTMTFSGREMRFKDQGKEMMLKLIEELSEVSKMEAPLALRPSNFSVTLVPLK